MAPVMLQNGILQKARAISLTAIKILVEIEGVKSNKPYGLCRQLPD